MRFVSARSRVRLLIDLLFAIPLIEFYYSRHKLYFVLAGVCIATTLGLAKKSMYQSQQCKLVM